MFKIKLVFYLLLSDYIIPNHLKFFTVRAIRVAGSGRREFINDTQVSALNTSQTRIVSTINGRQINSGLFGNHQFGDTLVSSDVHPQSNSSPNNDTINVDEQWKSRETSSHKADNTEAKVVAEPFSNETYNGNQQMAENANKITTKLKDNSKEVKNIESPNQSQHTIVADEDVIKGHGDRSIYDRYHEIRRKSGQRRGIPWNTTSNEERILIEEQPVIPRTSFVDKFRNETFLIVTASHGLFFNEYAETLIFHETFEHFIQFPIPISRELRKTFEQEDCLVFINRSIKSLSGSGDGSEFCEQDMKRDLMGSVVVQATSSSCQVSKKYTKICDRLVHYYDKQVEELQMIIDDSYTNFKQNIRNKRVILTTTLVIGGILITGGLGGLISGGIAGYFSGQAAAQEEVGKLTSVLQQMEKNISQIHEGVQVNNRLLCGLSQNVVEMEKDLKNEMKLMADNIRFQISNLEDSISLVSQTVEQEIRLEAMVKALEDYVNLHLSSLRNTMILELQQIKTWESIFNTLSFGRLPKELLGYNQLKSLLKEIHQNIYTLFDLALNDEEFPLYYTLPLVNYFSTQTPEGYALYVHLRIPLKIVRVNHRFNLITVHPHPFPCLNNECILDKGRLVKGQLQSFDLPQLSLLVNTRTYQIQHQINMDYLTCQESGRKKLCFSFSPNVLQSPTSCIEAIYDWNETEIITWCDFKSAKRDTYRVIPIKSNTYLIHRDIINFYTQFCKDTPTERIHIEDWSEIMIIPEYCEVFITATNQKLLGPFSELLSSTNEAQRITYESKLIEKISAKYSNLTALRAPAYDSGRFIRSIEERFETNKNASLVLDARLSSDELSKLALFNIQAQKELKQSMSNLNTKFKTYTLTGTLWGVLSLIADSIQMLTVLTVIFGLLSYTNFFGLFGATLIIIHPRVANAWELQLIPDIKLLPDITVDVLSDTTAIAFFMNIAFVILFIAFAILFVTYGVFRKIEFSSHYGKGPTLQWERERTWQLSPCCLMVHLNFKGNLIRCIKVENVHIKLSIDGLFSEVVKNVKVKNSMLNWGIIKKEGQLIIVLSEPIALMGFDCNNERVEEATYKVEIPIDVSAFNSIPRSEAIRKRGNSGLCFVDTVSKSLGVKLRAGTNIEAPPRYIEVMPSSPQMAEVYV